MVSVFPSLKASNSLVHQALNIWKHLKHIMNYHCKIEYSTEHYWYNYAKEEIITELLIPFINGQVVLINSGVNKKLLNLKNVSRLSIYRTEYELDESVQSAIKQINDVSFAKFECTEALIKEAKLDLASPQSLSLLQKSFLPPKNTVFVIMKFNDKILDSAYETVVKPLFKKFKIEVIRVDEVQKSGKISDQILEYISSSKFIFSDLTGARPNCYYETGFAHALGKDVILACHGSEKVHFDLANHRFIIWETESELRRELTKRIKALMK